MVLVCMMMQGICAPLASAATVQQPAAVPHAFNPPTQINVALDEVSIVRLIAVYSGNGNTSALCTGLGAIVGSWPQTNPLTPTDQNNLILTSGNVVSNDGTPCVASSGTAAIPFTLKSIEVIFNTQFNDTKTFSVTKTNLVAGDIRCADTTSCSTGMTLFSVATKFANPFVTVAGNRDALQNPPGQAPGQNVQLALAKIGSTALLPQADATLTNATEGQVSSYRTNVSQYLNALSVNPTATQGEPGLLTIDELGNAIALQVATSNAVSQAAISQFLTAQPEWVGAQNLWRQQDANTVQASWRMGNQQYYQQKNYPNASVAFTAAQLNTDFVGTKEFAQIAAHQARSVGTGVKATPVANSAPSSPTIPGTNIALPSWWLVTIGVVVLLLLLVVLLVVLLIRRNRSKQAYAGLRPDFTRDWEAAQKEVLQQQQREQEAEPKNAGSEAAKPIAEVEPVTTLNMTCPRCETVVPKGASYCPTCSLRLVASDDKQTIQKSTTPVQQGSEAAKPKPVPAPEIVPPVQQNKEVPRPVPPMSPPFVVASKNDTSLPIPSSSIAEPLMVKQGLYSDPVQKPELGVGERAGQQLNSYRLLHLVGQGGSADVYLGEHIYLKTKAAIKVLQVRMTGHDIEGFVKEAQIIASLKHPHIVRVIDFGLDRSTPFLIMEYAASGTLRDRYPRGTVLPVAKILPYVKQIASALQYAHDQRLIHRDIKPENMLVEPNNDILLSDFGLATIMHTASAQNTKQVAGTALYMAPEQFKGKARAASDQYSLAVVVYEWLCGSPPYAGGDFIQLGFQHSYEALPPLREKAAFIAPSVEEVIAKALSKDATQRYESVTAFVHALEQAVTVR